MGNARTVIHEDLKLKFTKINQLHNLTPWCVKIYNKKGDLLVSLDYYRKYDECYSAAMMFTWGYKLGYKQALIAKQKD
jgi:hypothetical protein